MSLYALIRNSYDPVSKEFNLSTSDIELEGHLDGNLCRCTGYKPILQAAKTFVTEDLKGKIAVPASSLETGEPLVTACPDIPYHSDIIPKDFAQTKVSCGRPGGCCRDAPKPEVQKDPKDVSDDSSESKSVGHSSESITSTPPSEPVAEAPIEGE